MEKASGFINSDWMGATTSPTYLDCGSPGISTDTNKQGRFNVVVREEPRGVTVTVNTTWRAARSFGGSTTNVECVSTGILEGEIHTELRKRLGIRSQSASVLR